VQPVFKTEPYEEDKTFLESFLILSKRVTVLEGKVLRMERKVEGKGSRAPTTVAH
jgi:hypothetical protein